MRRHVETRRLIYVVPGDSVVNSTGSVRKNVTLRRVRVTIVVMETQEVLNVMSVCLYSCFSYPACKPHFFCAVLYCHLWPVWVYHSFQHCHINGTIFGGGGY
jgi:hypothetical protein